jgi:soluble lytic murein transglycosylase-like protein
MKLAVHGLAASRLGGRRQSQRLPNRIASEARIMTSLLRTFVYCWPAAALLGCSLPHPLPNDLTGRNEAGVHSPAAVNTTPLIDVEIAAPPIEAKKKSLAQNDEFSSAALSPKPLEKVANLKEQHKAQDESTIHEQPNAASDDDLIELWRNDMDRAMQQPPDERVLRISPAVEAHHRVRFYVEGFCGRMRDFFERALARSGKYRSMMADILRSEGLPEKLVYLALIESGFSTHAYSRAHALGPWQFMRATALQYGLTINSWLDERRDPVLSTRAAAAYLKDLHEKFGEWFLAAAAYNAGEGRVGTALQRSKTNDYWRLRQERKHLKLETRDYVPKFVAAAIIARQPERYGFEEISYEEPMEYDEVTINQPLRLETVARLANTQIDVIKELNPALLRDFTPPMDGGFTLRLPVGSQADFLTGYEQLAGPDKIKVSLHKVKKGELLARIAKKYNLTAKQLVKENGLKSRRLRPGQELIIVSHDVSAAPMASNPPLVP